MGWRYDGVVLVSLPDMAYGPPDDDQGTHQTRNGGFLMGWLLDCSCGMTYSGPIRFLVLRAMKRHIEDEHLADAYSRLMLGRWKA